MKKDTVSRRPRVVNRNMQAFKRLELAHLWFDWQEVDIFWKPRSRAFDWYQYWPVLNPFRHSKLEFNHRGSISWKLTDSDQRVVVRASVSKNAKISRHSCSHPQITPRVAVNRSKKDQKSKLEKSTLLCPYFRKNDRDDKIQFSGSRLDQIS